jgi:hypothetical protein
LNPARIAPVHRDDSLRPNGTACDIMAAGGRKLTLTEFPDPGGQAIYFFAGPSASTEPEELVRQ